MNHIIEEALRLGLWNQLDVYLARMLIKPNENNSLMVAVLTLSAYIRQGHVCLPLNMLTPNHLFYGSHVSLASKVLEKAGSLSIECWKKVLISSFVVSDGSFLAPLVLDKERLYLYRMWNDECLIASFFRSASKDVSDISEKKVSQIIRLLDRFFQNENSQDEFKTKSSNINWQKVAISMVLIRRLVVISGGPGTGKTSIISKLLMIILLLYNGPSLIIKMVAPTGKAVACMNKSVDLIIKKNFLDNKNSCCKYDFSIEALTLHRLCNLYFYDKRKNMVFTQYDLLYLDYLIIDECSMIDLSIIASIIRFLPNKTKVVLLGDHKQLPSVESGSFFSDLCYFSGKGYTENFCKRLKKLTGYNLSVHEDNKSCISDSFCLLQDNYRFSSISTLGKLAYAVSKGNSSTVLSLLTAKNNIDLYYMILDNRQDYFKMLISCSFGYSSYFNNIKCWNYKNLEYILNYFNKYRLLCVLREGPFGVSKLNIAIENILHDNRLIRIVNNRHYIGKPIIITANDSSLSLFNGQTGIILPDDNTCELYAYFLSLGGNIQKVSLHQLPKYETALVMTVHKSQGSEFEHPVLIFPNEIMPILSRELLYTGITRACKCLSIYATDRIINFSMNNTNKRCSGLIDRLKCL